jgi:hypothetical protein
VTIELVSLKGYLMEQQLITGLSKLVCTEEECMLRVTETAGDSGFEVLLKCRRPSLPTATPWVVVEDAESGSSTHTTYRAKFEQNEPAPAIVDAVRRILEEPNEPIVEIS